jgi:hypothetical protein
MVRKKGLMQARYEAGGAAYALSRGWLGELNGWGMAECMGMVYGESSDNLVMQEC